jgi:D-alanyl-D-alanine carboxypeptidase
MKKNYFSFCIALVLIVVPFTQVYAVDLGGTFDALVREQGLNPAQQAACASDASGTVLSYEADTKIIPASVSKLYLFDFALSKLPNNFRYTTTFIRSGDTLYINGAGDPQITIEHFRTVLDQMYADDSTAITTIVVSPYFYFEMTKNQSGIRTGLVQAVPGARVSFVADSYSGDGIRYQLQSIPLPAFLKITSNYSNNLFADVLFEQLGGADAFADFLMRTYGVGPETAKFATGSGLSGNYTTCRLTLQMLEHLDKALAARDLSLTDVMTMPVVDPGVLSTRGINSIGVESLVAKSGYLHSHHNLAGIINSEAGHAYFAIFTTYPPNKNGREVNRMVDSFTNSLLAQYSPSLLSFRYTPDSSIFENYNVTVR